MASEPPYLTIQRPVTLRPCFSGSRELKRLYMVLQSTCRGLRFHSSRVYIRSKGVSPTLHLGRYAMLPGLLYKTSVQSPGNIGVCTHACPRKQNLSTRAIRLKSPAPKAPSHQPPPTKAPSGQTRHEPAERPCVLTGEQGQVPSLVLSHGRSHFDKLG